MMGDDDKPFACPEVGCRMRFANEDHLMVHRMKHEMSLPLTPGLKPGQLLTFADQTPTPTRFLRNCEEIGLFNELKSNPFEEAFKKASEFIEPDGKSTEQPGQTSAVADTTVVCDNLNTPTPLLAPRNPPASPALAATTTQLLAAPSASFVPLPGPNKEVGSTVTPTSPVTIDQNAEVTVDSPVLCSSESPVVPPHDSNSLPQKTVISAVSAAPTTAAITTNVTAITTALSLSRAAVTTRAPSSVGVAGASAVPRVLATGVPQYMLQVMVQMPSGDMVPVQIPAAPAPLAQSNLPAAVVSITTSVAPSTTVASAPLTTVATTAAAPLSTKQILKAVLQQQSMKVTSEDSDSVKATYQVSPPARTLVNRVGRSQTLVRSPVTLPTISVTSPVMMTSPSGASPSVMSPRLQVHDVDTSTPLKRSRSSSPEEDSDERRRKFLERNRAAAARCRAKKKMWIGGLEKKADDMQDVNARLQLEVTQLRNEVAELKSLLLAHKDCPITLQQRNAGRLTFTTVTPKVEPPDHPAMDISGATETSESTHDSVSHVTVTTSTVGSTSSQPIILNIMPLVQDGS